MKEFIKYQSLGNDFIVFDWYKKPAIFMDRLLQTNSWATSVKHLCARHYGIGADNILILTSNTQQVIPEISIFNADGSQAQTCLNGLRCIAHHLLQTYHFPNSFTIKMGNRQFQCQAGDDIITSLDPVVYEGPVRVMAEEISYDGHVVNVGNPHFIVFKSIPLDWLASHGEGLESHPQFPQKTNVEFVSQGGVDSDGHAVYNMLVYERGCGITLACSSGAAAVTGLLYVQGHIVPEQKISLIMPGGVATTWVDAHGRVFLSAPAQPVYKGTVLLDVDI